MKINKTLTKAAAVTLTVTAGVAATTLVANADTNYTVQTGDTLSGIVQKYHLGYSSINKIVQVNHLTNANLLLPGQVLTIPDVQGNASATTTTTQSQGQSQAVAQSTNNQASSNTSSASTSSTSTQALSGSEQSAKDWIAAHESGGNYGATNGQYYGKYQLSLSYLGGDLSPAHQEQVANQYVAQRYGSWQNAQAHWEANGWY